MQKILPIQMQKRCCSNWCWAAVLASATPVLPNRSHPLPVDQPGWIDLAYGLQGCSGCCPGGCPDLAATCNLYGSMDQILYQAHLSSGVSQQVAAVGFSGIAQQIEKRGHPVIAQIDYLPPSSGSHYLLIYGYESDTQTLVIGDPASGEGVAYLFSTYSTPGAYNTPGDQNEHGSWNSVYFFA
jgi:hypothetical protein